MTAPRSTCRLQFHAGFTLDDAAVVVPYLARLGISHLYASPLFTARRGSMHGYDVVDYAEINPHLGGRAGLERLTAALRRHGMGLLLDIVPNHMAADAGENLWWRDVLAKGRHSRFAGFFDIDWTALRGRILLPVLGRPLDEALAAGEIRLEEETRQIAYFDHRFPLADASPRGDLRQVLEAQHYRLSWWRTAGDLINWRRFFDISGLVALRAERPAVFAATHRLVIALFAEGLIDGVRVDHVDGIADPGAYCRRLRRALARAGGRQPYILVEKILARGESLPAEWGVDGGTGYDFMADVAGLLHDPAGEAPLARLWARAAGGAADFGDIELQARRDLLSRTFAADLGRAAREFSEGPDMPAAALARSIAAVAARFPVYRLYPDGTDKPQAEALAAAGLDLPLAERPWFEAVARRLTSSDRQSRRAQMRFQLLTAPLAAKAVEDTSFYRYGRLLSHCEVGSSPRHFALPPDRFHRLAQERLRHYPNAMLTTATHDHKRGEDVRARLAVLSEIPDEWSRRAASWLRRDSIHWSDQLTLFQTLVAAWPARLDPADEAGVAEFASRVGEWQKKALREAKLRSDWAAPSEIYESACDEFLREMLGDPVRRAEIASFAARIGPAAAVNGLSHTMLRLTVPGMPDLYQGAEFWDESLVDPDNRRPVDFFARMNALEEAHSWPDLLRSWRDGRIKQALIARMLKIRATLPDLFASGSYRPLTLSGPRAKHALAFLREDGANRLLIAVTRLSAGLLGKSEIPTIEPAAWEGTIVQAGFSLERNMLAPQAPPAGDGDVPLAMILQGLPVACWSAKAPEPSAV